MTPTEVLILKSGSTVPFQATLSKNGVALNLTAATECRFSMRKRGEPEVVPVDNKPCTFMDRPNGVVQYAWGSIDETEIPGEYDAEFMIVWSDNTRTIVPNARYLTVRIEQRVGS